MPASLQPEEWLRHMRREYLDGFIKDGGAAVKFVVPLDDLCRGIVIDGIIQQAKQAGYLPATMDAATTKIHLAQHVFFKTAEQIPWRLLSQQVVRSLVAEEGFAVPSDGSTPLAQRIGDANQVNSDYVLMTLRRTIGNSIIKRTDLTKDFRVAMTWLCRAELTGGPDGETAVEAITNWLTGRNTHVSAVKPYSIFSGINRTNARHMFESLTHWVRYAGYTGLVIFMDIAKVTVARNPRDGTVYYTKPSVLDAYEVLRQFIDNIDRLDGCLMVVIADPAFLDEDVSGRGFGAYEALKFRVIDEVRDRKLANPLASLVRASLATNENAS